MDRPNITGFLNAHNSEDVDSCESCEDWMEELKRIFAVDSDDESLRELANVGCSDGDGVRETVR